MDHLTLAITHLGATRLADGRYAYYDDATRAYWASSARSLEALGAALDRGEPDAYSRWCSQPGTGEELPEGWEPGLEPRPCQCASVTGATGPCGYQADARLAYLPEDRRATARAAGGGRPASASQAVARGWQVLDVVAEHVEGDVEAAGRDAMHGGIEVAAWVADDGRLEYADADADADEG